MAIPPSQSRPGPAATVIYLYSSPGRPSLPGVRRGKTARRMARPGCEKSAAHSGRGQGFTSRFQQLHETKWKSERFFNREGFCNLHPAFTQEIVGAPAQGWSRHDQGTPMPLGGHCVTFDFIYFPASTCHAVSNCMPARLGRAHWNLPSNY